MLLLVDKDWRYIKALSYLVKQFYLIICKIIEFLKNDHKTGALMMLKI